MQGFGFNTLALLAAVGFAGPLLASVPRLRIPVIIGELVAGLVLGESGFGVVDVDNPTFELLANIGFALVMFVVGTHVPIRDRRMRSAVPLALARVVLIGVVAAALGVGLSAEFGTDHAALYAVLIASSSAALALPVIDSLGLQGPHVLSVTAQIAVADATSIVLLPLVIDVRRAPKAAVGALVIAGCAAVLFVLLRRVDRRGWRKRLHKYSEKLNFALELRISLLVLFALAALAVSTHVSSAVRHHRRVLRPAVLRVAGRLAAGTRVGFASQTHSAGAGPGAGCCARARRGKAARPAAETGGIVGRAARRAGGRGHRRQRGTTPYCGGRVGNDAWCIADDRGHVDRGRVRGPRTACGKSGWAR
jgi:predicted Kef-type K+ transport protein